MKHTATANINPDRQASVCLIVMGFTVEKQLYLSKRRLMTFPKDPGRQMPKESHHAGRPDSPSGTLYRIRGAWRIRKHGLHIGSAHGHGYAGVRESRVDSVRGRARIQD